VGTVDIAREAEVNERFRAVLSYDGTDAIQLDCPKLFRWLDSFTIFWRGYATSDDLYQFVNRSFRQREEVISTLFFFPHVKLHLPSREVEKVPSFSEEALIREYGSPGFLRYEIYPRSVLGGDFHYTRYTVWAEVATLEQIKSQAESNYEIGVFTTTRELEPGPMKAAIQALIRETIRPKIDSGASEAFLDRFYSILKNRVVS